jgi:two-component system CheB/CheR fusion protein
MRGRTASPHRWRVLIVEDNVDAAHSLRAIIELDGHGVAVAHSGDDGLELARRFRPHLVICDIGLPGIDGYTLARALREDREQPVLLVALTARAAPSDLQLATAAGFDRHYAKPLDPEQLHELYELLNDTAHAG